MNGNEMSKLEIRREETATFFLDTVVKPLRIVKGHEYAVDGDPNGNFKRVAARTGQTIYQVWMSHFMKHMDAIENFVRHPEMVMAEPIDGRIADGINYLTILYTILDENRRSRIGLPITQSEPSAIDGGE